MPLIQGRRQQITAQTLFPCTTIHKTTLKTLLIHFCFIFKLFRAFFGPLTKSLSNRTIFFWGQDNFFSAKVCLTGQFDFQNCPTRQTPLYVIQREWVLGRVSKATNFKNSKNHFLFCRKCSIDAARQVVYKTTQTLTAFLYELENVPDSCYKGHFEKKIVFFYF